MKKIFSKLAMLLVASVAVVSCSDDDYVPSVTPGGAEEGSYYILCSGNSGNNNSSLQYYEKSQNLNVASGDIFVARNGKAIGDTANDMVIYDSKIYIAVSNSNILYVTDLDGLILEQFDSADFGGYASPRKLVAYDGAVYMTLWEGGKDNVGAVAMLDTESCTIKKISPCSEKSPEGLVVANDKLYVAVSGYDHQYFGATYCSHVDVFALDLESKSTIVVGCNQSLIAAAGDYVYTLAIGNYDDILSAVYAIDTKDNSSSVMIQGDDECAPLELAVGANDVLYVAEGISSEDTGWLFNGVLNSYSSSTNTKTGEFVSNADYTYKLNADATSGEVFLLKVEGWSVEGDVEVYNSNGTLLETFAAGINPMAVAVVR